MKDTIKAPHRFVAEGKGFRLYTRGEKTDTTYGTMAAAKKAVLSMNGAWRSKHGKGADSAVITNPRRKYDEYRDGAGYRVVRPQEGRVHQAQGRRAQGLPQG